jgi:hypothetical protein
MLIDHNHMPSAFGPGHRRPCANHSKSLSHSSACQAAKASCMAPRRDLCHQADGATADGIRTSRRLRAARLHAQPLFCDPDYMLCVIAVGLPAFQQLYDDRLATPGVQRLSATPGHGERRGKPSPPL